MLSPPHNPEQALLILGVVAYLMAAFAAWAAVLTTRKLDTPVFVSTAIAVIACLLSIVLRWQQTGNGPFLTLYEVL
ncbi:MAG: hypothetical protein HKP57_11705, partial [Halobacteria archaeon]|nr:hypothetical protein [Halobacteria archaeon]